MITNKYCAGLVDSDGYIAFNVNKTKEGFHVGPRVTIKQRKDRSQVLYRIAEQWDVKVYDDDNTHCIVFCGNKARRFLEQIKNHLVIKPDVAEFVLKVSPTVCNEKSLKELKNALKVLKADQKETKKNYPSRQWLAGYFDGDGSIQSDKKGNLRLQFTSHINEVAGLKLIQKAFKGSVSVSNNTAKLYINIPYRYSKNKVEAILGFFGKHCIIKQSQVQYVIGHAGKVDTEELYNKLRQLKQPASTE